MRLIIAFACAGAVACTNGGGSGLRRDLAGLGDGGGVADLAVVDGAGYQIAGHTLTVREQVYGATTDYFCATLAHGEFMVLLTDFTNVCGSLASSGSAMTFHSGDTTSLQLIMPSIFPTQHLTYTVGQSDCTTMNAPNTQAVAYFAHNDPIAGKYDVHEPASAGTITVASIDQGTNQLHGTFTLEFSNGTAVGDFDADLCSAIVPGTAQ